VLLDGLRSDDERVQADDDLSPRGRTVLDERAVLL
jgi:hypothetical protein